MSTADLTNPIFTDKNKAREYLEAQRWPEFVTCPHCGGIDKITKMEGRSHRPGLYLCGDCRGNFSVTVGTVYERSHIPLHKWLLATHLMASSEKGISAHQLHRMLGITYKSAWFMAHRIREGMKPATTEPMGVAGKNVEVDETYIGRKEGVPKRRSHQHKHTVVTLVERGGVARSFHVGKASAREIGSSPITSSRRARCRPTKPSSTSSSARSSPSTRASTTCRRKDTQHRAYEHR